MAGVAAAVLALGAASAYATGGNAAADSGGSAGRADAVVLRTGLDVSLLGKAADVPVDLVLNEVHAPADAHQTTLSTTLDGVEGGKPVQLLRADVATARATTNRTTAQGYANLVRAKLHVPGLPLLSLIEIEQVTSKAVCRAGKRPTATSTLPGSVLVLGKKVTLSASGTAQVSVPGVGEVRLDLARTTTTARSAAATALDLKVSVDPLKLGVAKVEGRLTLAEASCKAPVVRRAESEDPAKPTKPAEEKPAQEKPGAGSGTGVKAGAGQRPENLAETGSSSSTPYVAGGAGALVVLGAGAVVLSRRRRAAGGRRRG